MLGDKPEEQIRARGDALWTAMHDAVPGLFNQRHWQARMLDWAMRDQEFKTALFRFVDVLPMLRSTSQVAEHVHEYLLGQQQDLPRFVRALLRATERSLTSGLAASLIRTNTTQLARNFIAGADAESALSKLRRLHQNGYACTVDLLGEITLSAAEAAMYGERYMQLIGVLAEHMPSWPGNDFGDQNHLGPIPRANISVKLSALEPHLDPADLDGSVSRLSTAVLPILVEAREKNVFVNLDLEHWELHEITYTLFEELLSRPELRDWPHLGIVVQAYLLSAPRDLDRLCALSRTRGTPITVRLVKGAYWDQEVVRSRKYGFACPVFLHKAETDHQFEALSVELLSREELFPALGSHNLRSVTHALVMADRLHLPKEALEIQMLYGMAEPERQALKEAGYRVRVYTPLGELLPGIAYLLRRLLENTANQSFLRLGFHDHVDVAELLAPPDLRKVGPLAIGAESPVSGSDPSGGSAATVRDGGDNPDDPSPFENCAPTDFTDRVQRESFARTVAEIPASFPRQVPVVVGGNPQPADQVLRESPSESEQIVARVSLATTADAEEAIRQATEAWPAWRERPLRERAELLEALADLLERDRLELAALQVYEVGKPWTEADADVVEAIDFCRYYARQAWSELAQTVQDRRPGEINLLRFEGRGPTAVIAPWNFPLAILTGMTGAALVAGNTVIVKPSRQSSAVGHALFLRLLEAGIPANVAHFLPGRGEQVGMHLVQHPDVAQVAFTGSKQVGLGIIEACGCTQKGQRQLKRVVCEMGGKNAIVVDDDADLDAAVAAIVKSAFGYAGQKCSACSRCISVGKDVHETVSKRLVEACRSLHVGPAHEPDCQLGPVVDRDAHRRLLMVAREIGNGARTVFVGEAPDQGYYVPPVLFEVDDPRHELMQRELFGPLLGLIQVDSFERALEVACDTEYALTGALFSRNPAHIQRAKSRFRVGNLYINAPCTGALVGRQPFGGFGLSGFGTKAGGPGYLQQFADPICVAENTVRHGFAPEIE